MNLKCLLIIAEIELFPAGRRPSGGVLKSGTPTAAENTHGEVELPQRRRTPSAA